MNSDSGSTGLPVLRFIAWARSMYTGFSSLSSLFVAWMSPVFSLIMKRSPAPSPERIYLSDPSPLSWSECSWWWNENNQEGGKINNWDTILHISSHYHDAGLLIPSQKAVHFFQEIRWYLSRRTEWMEWCLDVGFEVVFSIIKKISGET